jgi:hypothetical protein
MDEDVVYAIERVERAIKDKTSTAALIGYMCIGAFLWTVPGQIWHAKWRYALSYGVSGDKVIVDPHPHDCAFLAAPLGEKYCHYDRDVSSVHWATSQAGNPLASFDEGKTWTVVTNPDPSVTWPKYDTVTQVYISWKKVEE